MDADDLGNNHQNPTKDQNEVTRDKTQNETSNNMSGSNQVLQAVSNGSPSPLADNTERKGYIDRFFNFFWRRNLTANNGLSETRRTLMSQKNKQFLAALEADRDKKRLERENAKKEAEVMKSTDNMDANVENASQPEADNTSGSSSNNVSYSPQRSAEVITRDSDDILARSSAVSADKIPRFTSTCTNTGSAQKRPSVTPFGSGDAPSQPKIRRRSNNNSLGETLDARRLLMVQQNEAFLAALKADRDRERRKQERANAEEANKKAIKERKLKALESVPKEPSKEEGVITLTFRLLSGMTIRRNFRLSDTLYVLGEFIISQEGTPLEFELVRYPNATVPFKNEESSSKTLQEFGITKNEVITMSLLEEEKKTETKDSEV